MLSLLDDVFCKDFSAKAMISIDPMGGRGIPSSTTRSDFGPHQRYRDMNQQPNPKTKTPGWFSRGFLAAGPYFRLLRERWKPSTFGVEGSWAKCPGRR